MHWGCKWTTHSRYYLCCFSLPTAWGVGLQIKSTHHYSGLIIQLGGAKEASPFLFFHQMPSLWPFHWLHEGTREEISGHQFQTQQTKGKNIDERNELISNNSLHCYYMFGPFWGAVRARNIVRHGPYCNEAQTITKKQKWKTAHE